VTHVLRAAGGGDLDAIYKMAKRTGGGFTNLPPNRSYLRRKLERAEASFARQEDDVGNDEFLFVLENVATGKVVGTCQLFSKIGSTWPFYSYRMGRVTQFSKALNRTVPRRHTLALHRSRRADGGRRAVPAPRRSGRPGRASCWRAAAICSSRRIADASPIV
jgi:arginine/ornithine N-succinyltransferase beta subunit